MDKVKKAPAAEAADKPVSDQVKFWQDELQAAKKREKTYRKFARELIDIYDATDEDVPFNILYSNTETLAPALYNAPPRPDTRPRSKVANPVADAASGLIDAYLTTFIDSGDARYPSFDSNVSQNVVQGLVPGRGILRFHYRAEVQTSAQGTPEKVKDETVFSEVVGWDNVLFGYAKTWNAVPWVAFIHTFTQEEAEAELGRQVASKLTYERPGEDSDDDSSKAADAEETARVATLYEIWHKVSRKVIWLEGCSRDDFVKPPMADPYALEGFYPIPEPLQFFQRIGCFIPVPLYKLYKSQAMELNKCTRRIAKLIDGMKIRGFYDSNVEGLEKIFESEENTLIALTSLAALGQGAKAENAIWLVPIEKHITVLQQLIIQRQQIKQVIYEIMGIADIMRGSTMASETLGAQELKNKWGTLRLKRAQKAVATFIRDGLRIAAELGFSKLSPDTLKQMTGSTLPSQQDMDRLEAQVQELGEAPPEAAQHLVMPTFEEALALCQSDILRRYVIDIETNSTIDADASEDKEDMAAFLNALSQFLNGLAPMLEKGLLPVEVLKGVLIALSKRFRMGRDLDPYFQKLGQGQPQGAAANEQAKKQLEEQGKQLAEGQKKLQAEGERLKKEKLALEKGKMDFQLQQAQAEMQKVIGELQKQVKDAKVKATLDTMLLKINAATEKLRMTQAADAAEDATEIDKD